MKVIVTGTVGLDKVPYLEQVANLARQGGQELTICHVGQRMYAEAPDVAPGRILDLPLSRLHLLRRSIFKDIMVLAESSENLIINTHATFRWKHGLFPAFDFDHIGLVNADMYICLIDNVDALHARLEREHQVDHSLKDLLVWREEETLATELMMLGCAWRRNGRDDRNQQSRTENQSPTPAQQPPAKFYIIARGHDNCTAPMLYRLMFQPEMPRCYLSFPMTHVADMPEVLAQIDDFRAAMREFFVVFDPADLEEQQFYQQALTASEQGRKVIELETLGRNIRFDVREILQVAGDIHEQLYARDFALIDQADMIVSYIPRRADGKPVLSSGVERELQHAYEATKEVYIVWRPDVQPSPFLTETATKIFADTDEAIRYFKETHKVVAKP